MSEVVVNDIFHELFDENQRLIDEFSLNKKYFNVLQKYRYLLKSICSESDSNEDIELRQRFSELEDEFKFIEEEIKTINTENRKTLELRKQIKLNDRRLRRHNRRDEDYEEEEEEDDSLVEDNEQQMEKKSNFKFLSESDRVLEEEGMVVTERDPKNSSILVVRMADNSQVFGYRCNWSDCQYVSVSKPKVETHLRSVHDRDGLFICSKGKCRAKFVSQKLLSNHLNDDHSKQYKCDYDDCGFQCRTRQHLTDHLRRHTGEKPYVCAVDDCGKGFATRQELRRHNNTVHTKETLVCDWPGCELAFKTQKALNQHQNNHTFS